MTEIERLWTQVEANLPPTITDYDLLVIKTTWHDGASAMLDAASRVAKLDDPQAALHREGDYLDTTLAQLRANIKDLRKL